MIDPATLALPASIKCYNSCYDSATQRVLDEQEKILGAIKRIEPDAHVTYFPVEGQHVVHVYGRELSGYHSTRGAAIADAYNRMFQ